MMSPIDPMLFFYFMAGLRLMESPIEKQSDYIYKPHTTSYVISNEDMYDVDQIVRDAFIVKEE